jgi:molybdopterin-guanine dinucleotide biosynthesis protein B
MNRARTVAVVGYKDSGKTRVVEALVRELTGRGLKVGTLKHTAEDTPLDTPGKDTWRHRKAGSEAAAILHEKGAALFLDRHLAVTEAVNLLGNLDLVVLEGFKTLETVARIVVPRNQEDLDALTSELNIAVVDLTGEDLESSPRIPTETLDQAKELSDIVDQRAFPMLPGLDCHGCGYDSCKEMAKAIMDGRTSPDGCATFSPGFRLRVDGEEVSMGTFVRDITRNVVLGLLRSLKGVDTPGRVELEFEVDEDD